MICSWLPNMINGQFRENTYSLNSNERQEYYVHSIGKGEKLNWNLDWRNENQETIRLLLWSDWRKNEWHNILDQSLLLETWLIDHQHSQSRIGNHRTQKRAASIFNDVLINPRWLMIDVSCQGSLMEWRASASKIIWEILFQSQAAICVKEKPLLILIVSQSSPGNSRFALLGLFAFHPTNHITTKKKILDYTHLD